LFVGTCCTCLQVNGFWLVGLVLVVPVVGGAIDDIAGPVLCLVGSLNDIESVYDLYTMEWLGTVCTCCCFGSIVWYLLYLFGFGSACLVVFEKKRQNRKQPSKHSCVLRFAVRVLICLVCRSFALCTCDFVVQNFVN
jgi:hypothetical protein